MWPFVVFIFKFCPVRLKINETFLWHFYENVYWFVWFYQKPMGALKLKFYWLIRIMKAASVVMKLFLKVAKSHMDGFPKVAANSSLKSAQNVYLSGFWKSIHVASSSFQKLFHDRASNFWWSAEIRKCFF